VEAHQSVRPEVHHLQTERVRQGAVLPLRVEDEGAGAEDHAAVEERLDQGALAPAHAAKDGRARGGDDLRPVELEGREDEAAAEAILPDVDAAPREAAASHERVDGGDVRRGGGVLRQPHHSPRPSGKVKVRASACCRTTRWCALLGGTGSPTHETVRSLPVSRIIAYSQAGPTGWRGISRTQ